MTFYDVYIRLCDGAGETPSAVALKLGFSKAMVSKWKRGVSPTDRTRLKIATHFGISTADLADMEAEKKEPSPHTGEGLSDQETQLVNAFRAASPEIRQAALAAALAVLMSGKVSRD